MLKNIMENKRVLLVGERKRGVTSSRFIVTLASPLHLLGSWTVQVESIFFSYSNLSLQPGKLPTSIIVCADFVDAVVCNDTYVRLLCLCSLEADSDKGFKSVSIHFPLKRMIKVVKDYISHIEIDIRDQRNRSLLENLLRGDIVIELLFCYNV